MADWLDRDPQNRLLEEVKEVEIGVCGVFLGRLESPGVLEVPSCQK